ncbi:MAG: carboxypeptidase regulatory-like domain-containing protein [Bacteroidaceae bacterium]|nr:carboxypeptidase regulatory-like domain-containing protein [Bacteroidaceae bacterium]
MKYFVFGLLALFSTFVKGQTIITGNVHSQDGAELESVIITARNPVDSAIVGYTFTDSKGAYLLKINSPNDSIRLVLTGFNVKTDQRIIANRNATIDWKTTEESLVLKEVQIKAQKMCGSITSQSTCSGECISGVIKYGETDYAGYCTWNSSTSTCSCGNLQPWP